jgi:methionyl-tRNA formyltransferase
MHEGTPDVAANCLRILQTAAVLQDSNFDIVAVVTQPPAPVGRTKKITASPVQITAEELSIPVLSPEKAKDEDFLSALEALSPDLCITAAYGNYLPKRFLSIPKCGTVNIHPSLLPKYRGAAPAQRCLEAGDATSGVSVLFTVQKMDAGPIIKQHTCVLSGQEKAPDFLVDMFSIGTNLLIEALPPIFSGDILRDVIQQDESQATAADKLSPLEARTDFSCLSALQVHNKARGLAGWPGLWSTFTATPEGGAESEPQRIKIITTVLKDWTAVTPTRDILVIRDGKRDLLQVVCGDGSLLGISEVQPSGKKVMPVRDFVNGLRGSTLRWTVPPLPEASDA